MAMTMRRLGDIETGLVSIGLVGATGAVGTEFIQLLERGTFPLGRLRLLASERSAGKPWHLMGQTGEILVTNEENVLGCDIVFFAADSDTSKRFAPVVAENGGVAIDNSSAFRMSPNVPLVVPEVNGADIFQHKGIIANPNCSTILLCMALAPLRALGTIRRVIVSTYQAVSGAGAPAMTELETQSLQYLNGEREERTVFVHPIAFNLFSHDTPINEHGYNGEEWKVAQETKKILHADIPVTATCVRVPIFRAHSESVHVEFADTCPNLDEVRHVLAAFPGVVVVDDRENNHFPMPREAAGLDEVFVGRIRKDLGSENALNLWLCGDQILKGAALNGFQIAERLVAGDG